MNFTKPGVTGGNGYKKDQLKQRIFYKSDLSGKQDWQTLSNQQLQFIKTKVPRRRKDVIAGGQDSDQDEEIEQQEEEVKKKKKVVYYYALVFEVEFEYDQDSVYFSFSQPYPYTQIINELS